jgi:tetratricopeptide (TPR) repeat protein
MNIIKPGAVDLDPEDVRTRLNIASLYLKQKKFEKALENDTEPAKQYDDSLFYLHQKKPELFDYVDRIGQAYMQWADQVRVIPQKREILSRAYHLYFKHYNTYPESHEALSRITHLSVDLDDNVDKKLDFISQHGLIPKMHHQTMAKLGLYFTEKERYNVVYQMISVLNDQKTEEPLAYYMMGNYYYKADNMDLAELSLIKGIHFNGVYNAKKQRIDTRDKKLESRMANMLGEVYLALANEYTGPTKFNQEKQDKFVKLSLYHFDQAKINDPDNALSYFHHGNMHYKFYNDYKKSSEDFMTAYTMLKENQDVIPSELYYHLSVSLYQMGKAEPARSAEFAEKSLEFLSELRTGSAFRVRPAVEYLLGMIYYELGYFEEAREKFSNVLEYYQEDLAGFLRNPNPMSVRQNKIFYLLAVTHNNLGCVYQTLSIKDPSGGYEERARLHFYKSIEMGTRYRNDNILALSRLNLNDSLLRDNLRYAENFRIGKRPAYIYPFTPRYLEEYE